MNLREVDMHRAPRFVVAALAALMCLRVPVAAQGREQLDRIQDSIHVLRDLTQQADMRIPQYLLERAEAIVVIPDMIRGGFVVGAKHGKGLVSVRDRAANRWSQPAFVKLTGGSIGWQIGAQQVDLVLLVMNENGVRKLLDNRFTLGGELSATAGPVGRSANAATDASLTSEILAYSRAKGLFAGATFEGASLRADDDANVDFYGRELDLRDIVLNPSSNLRVPVAANEWVDTLRELSKPTARLETPAERVDRDRDRDRDRDVRPIDRDLPRAVVYPDGAEPITITLLADKPDRYYGHRVSITAPVEDVYSTTTFTLDEDTRYSNGRKVIVINPQPAGRVEDRSRVTVVGTLYKFDRDDIEKRLGGWRWDVPKDVVKAFDDHPVLIAESIRSTSHELVGAPVSTAPAFPAYTSAPAWFTGKLLTPEEIAKHADKYYHQQIMVAGSIENLYSRSVFSIDENNQLSTGHTVLIVAPTLVRPLGDNQDVSVIGELIKFDKGDIERRFKGYKLDLGHDLKEGLENWPVILASSVRSRDGQELLGNKIVK